MAAKPSRPSLIVSRTEAMQRIQNQIDKGKLLLNVQINSRSDWERARIKKQKWSDYNIELLKRIADTDDLAKEYDPPRAGSFPMVPTLKDLRERLFFDINYYIGRLESMKEKLELIPESPPLIGQNTTSNESKDTTNTTYLIKLFQILSSRFDEGEVKTLCFGLEGVDYDSLPDQGKENKIRELISYLERRERLAELMEIGKELRPDINWDEF